MDWLSRQGESFTKVVVLFNVVCIEKFVLGVDYFFQIPRKNGMGHLALFFYIWQVLEKIDVYALFREINALYYNY